MHRSIVLFCPGTRRPSEICLRCLWDVETMVSSSPEKAAVMKIPLFCKRTQTTSEVCYGLFMPCMCCHHFDVIVRHDLYSTSIRPRDLQQHQGPSADLNLLINLATVTHKYHFATTETWSLDAICNVMSKGSAIWKTSPSLAVILGLAMLCEHEPLRELVISTWVSRLLSAELPPIPAILAADKYELPQLLGAAYYAQVLEMDKTNSTFTPPSDDELSRGQLIALLSGHWALVKRWEHLQMRPLTFQRSTGCTMHVHGCVAMWNAQWNKHRRSETLLAYPSADILGRLQCLLALLEADELVSQQLTAGCRASALRELASVIVAQKITLADFFVDRTQPAPGSPSSH